MIQNDCTISEEEELFRGLVGENLRRGLRLTYVVMIAESLFILIDVISQFLRVNHLFQYDSYLLMYLLMLTVSGIYVFAIKRFGDPTDKPIEKIQRFYVAMIVYITFMMVWGSVITLMDQVLYGQLIVFVINTLTCSVLYAMNARSFSIPYISSCLVLLIGLPFVQHSSDILVGHYVNISFFLVLSWVASRMLYSRYCKDFKNKVMLNQANQKLQNIVQEYNLLNEKLLQANSQLKEASLIDELTGLPNRRSFRLFIDHALNKLSFGETCLSILMIDIDQFKQYNDYYGHNQGDEVLKAVAGAIERSVDFAVRHVVRWGGEEFLCAIFHSPNEDISPLSIKMREAIQALHILHANTIVAETVSISIGCTTILLHNRNDISKAIEQADQALYQAKAKGRNCCCSYQQRDSEQ